MSTPHEADFGTLVDLASERLAATVIFANDDFFAEKENLLREKKPIFIEGKYTDRGKWMDGWESRRRRISGHDYAIIRLGVPGVVREVIVDTAFFRGNFPEQCSIEGASVTDYPTPDVLDSAAIEWSEILPKSKLNGDSINRFKITGGAAGANTPRITHVRFHIYPDGGVARLRILGEVVPEPRWVGRVGSTVDLAAVEHGAVVESASDMFFGSRHNLIMPNRAVDMGDGWETKRSRREGPDWVVVKLAAPGTIERIVIDTAHFKGNFPESAALCVAHVKAGADASKLKESDWVEVLTRTKLLAHTAHVFDEQLGVHGHATHARLRIWPDGGVSRLRLFGHVSDEGRERVGLRALNAMPDQDAYRALLAVCSSRAWAHAMLKKRPFAGLDVLLATSAEAWAKLGEDDWQEAFAAHPRIGAKKPEPSASVQSKKWSEGEQSRVASASDRTKKRLAKINEAYEKKFGRIYIVCATAKSAEEMVLLAERRMKNGPAKELRVAADEQRKITELRLRKLVMR